MDTVPDNNYNYNYHIQAVNKKRCNNKPAAAYMFFLSVFGARNLAAVEVC